MIERLRQEIHSPLTKGLFRENETDFTRERKLNFQTMVGLLLRGHKFSLQNALNKVFTQLGELYKVPTASAYSQAREKLRADVFVHLNEIICRQFYVAEPGSVQLWHGHRLVGGDGTYLNLPDTQETRQEFSVQENQHAGAACVQALAVVLFDLLNGIGLAAAMGRRQAEKKLLRQPEVCGATNEGDVLVLERGFADYSVLAWAVAEGRQVVVRVPRRWMKRANEFWKSGQAEAIVELECPGPALNEVRANNLAERLAVRLIRVDLDGGEVEVLATTLLDDARYRAAEFKTVYGWRWREETYFGRLKTIFEVERFSGKSVRAIRQDFYGVMFLASLEAVLTQSDGQAVAEKGGAKKNGSYQINHAVSYAAMLERVVELLLGAGNGEQILSELHHLFRTNPVQQRAGRHNKRSKELRYAHKLRYHKYKKRVLA